MTRRALITGITGRTAPISPNCAAKGYEVHGTKRRSSLFNTDRIDLLPQDPHEHTGVKLFFRRPDRCHQSVRIVQQVKPDEIYNLAAQSHVVVSFETPEYTANSDALGALRLLEAIRILGLQKRPASIRHPRRDVRQGRRGAAERATPFYPRSPYGAAKVTALDHRELS